MSVAHPPDHRAIQTISIAYKDYSDADGNTLNGTESVSQSPSRPTEFTLEWHSNIHQTGTALGTKVTSPDGFKLTIDVMEDIFQATGTLTTVIDKRTYTQPTNGH